MCDVGLLRYFCVVAIVTTTRRSTCGSTLGSAGRFEPPYATRGPSAHAVPAAPSHVVGAHSTESAPFLQLEERGTTHLRRAGGLLLGTLTKERGDFLSGGQADDQAAAQHRVDLAI